MITCQEVSTLISTGSLADAPLKVWLAARLHLAMCRHCRAFKRQIELIGRTARRLSSSFEDEPTKDFETKISELFRRESSLEMGASLVPVRAKHTTIAGPRLRDDVT